MKKLEYVTTVFKQQAERAPQLVSENKLPGAAAYLDAVPATLEKVDTLLELLRVIRGEPVHLETVWQEGRLTCRATDPRPADWKKPRVPTKGGKATATG